MANQLALLLSLLATFMVAACIVFVTNTRLQPTRGTRLPLGPIHQNVQPEKKSTFLKPSQRPLSVPNLKSLFNSNTKAVSDENKDIEKIAVAERLPTTYIPPVRKTLAKRNTTIFRDPILKTVEEVEDGLISSTIVTEKLLSGSSDISAPQSNTLNSFLASSYQREAIIGSSKDITLAQPKGTQNSHITDIIPPSTNAENVTDIYAAPPALSQASEPEVQSILEAAIAADNYLNLPALHGISEPRLSNVLVTTDGFDIPVKVPSLSTTSDQAICKISSSSELEQSLIVNKVEGPTKRRSNPTLSMVFDARQATTIHHASSEQSTKQNVPQTAIPMLSEDRVVTALLRNTPQPPLTISETLIAATARNTKIEDKITLDVPVPGPPTASREGMALTVSDHGSASRMLLAQEPHLDLLVTAEEISQAPDAIVSKVTSDSVEKICPDDGPQLADLNGLKAPDGIREAIARVLKPPRPVEAPTDTQRVSVKKRRDITIRSADYQQTMPWAPALEARSVHHHLDNCAAVGVLGPKALETRYLTPHHAVPQELHGVDPSKEEDTYDSYDEEDGYVTARSYRSNGENTNDGATTDLFPRWNQKARREIAEATALVEQNRTQEDIDDEAMDPTMVAEYADDIFAHLRETEVKMLPNPFYMEEQNELQWSMRSVLMDWLVQVHSRCNLLPETLFITGNFVDRFLSGKIVSLGKLQLVGATALFLAAKKEEINCPTLSEIVYMVDNTYTADELIKAERYMLNILKWELEWPGPMSFLRRISKADDYDLETRTLAKYFLEVTLMEERFIGTPCSFAAAASHCLARLLLGKGPWTPYHVYYSNYTYAQLHPLLRMLLYCVENPLKHHAAVYEKYADRRYKRASTYVEVELQRGFVLPPAPTTSNRNIVDDIVAPYTMTPFYNHPFNYHLAPALSSSRVFSS